MASAVPPQLACPEDARWAGVLSRASWTGPRGEGVRLDLPPSDLGFGSDLSLQSMHLLHAHLPPLNLCSPSCPIAARFLCGGTSGPGGRRGSRSPSQACALVPGKAQGCPPWASASPSISPVSLVLTAGFTRSHHDFRQIHTHQVQLFTSHLC